MISGAIIGVLCYVVIVHKMKIKAWSGKYFAYFIPSIVILNALVEVAKAFFRI